MYQRIGRHISAVGAEYAGKRVPEGGFTVSSFAVSNNQGFDTHFPVKNGAWELLASMGPKKAAAAFNSEQARSFQKYENGM